MTYLRRLTAALLGVDQESADVRLFLEKFRMINYWVPGFLTRRKQLERAELLREELDEFINAATLEEQADALVDLVYIAKGTAVMMGLPWEQLWNDVQRANMAKERGIGKRGHKVDVVKPANWVAPQGAEILAKNGWDFGDAPWNSFDSRALRDDYVHHLEDIKGI